MVTHSHHRKMDTFVYNKEKITKVERANGYLLTSQKKRILSFTMKKKEHKSKDRIVTRSHKKMDTFVYNEEKITRIKRANGYGLTSQKNGYVRLH